MKIVILGTAYPYRGGLATFNERLARQFQAEGHDVEVVTFTLQYPSFLFPGKTQYSNEIAPTDLEIKRWVNSCNPFNWVSVGRRIRKMQPDMLITCYWMAFFAPCYGIIERIVKGNGKTRCVALVHNMIPHEPSLLDKSFAPFYVKSTDGFVALSDSVVRDIDRLDKHNKPKTFSPHPIYDHYGERMPKAEACKALNLDADKDYMLFFGLVRAYKGLDLLLDAFGKMHAQMPDLRLLVAGEFYEQEEAYRKQIADNGLVDKVIIRNEFIPDADLRKYFGAYLAAVGPVDAIVFTAGIGENAGNVREKVCAYLGYLGIEIDKEANGKRGEEIVISTPDSKVKVLVVPTNEELAIARETVALV